jgi:hypothetical protein
LVIKEGCGAARSIEEYLSNMIAQHLSNLRVFKKLAAESDANLTVLPG